MALFRHSIITYLRYGIAQNNVRTIKRWVAPTLRELEKRKKKMEPQPPQPRSTYLEWNYDAEIFAFAKRLGETFDDSLLKQAFTNRSYVIKQELQESPTDMPPKDNRELTKEGEQFIADCIRQRFQNKYSSEVVDAIQNHLCSETMISHVASHIGIGDLVLSADFPIERQTLANTFKAVVAALQRSSDDKTAETFVTDFLMCQLNGKEVCDILEVKNPYQYLLQLAQKQGHSEIEPRLCNQSATNTILANYQIGLYSDKKLLGIGWGESVQIAKDTAALDAIQKIQNKKK